MLHSPRDVVNGARARVHHATLHQDFVDFLNNSSPFYIISAFSKKFVLNRSMFLTCLLLACFPSFKIKLYQRLMLCALSI